MIVALRVGGTSVDDWLDHPRALVTAAELLHDADRRRR